MTGSAEVLRFWLEEKGPQDWYAVSPALDDEIRTKFGGLWDQAMAGGLCSWLASPEGALAYIILTDQFSRNMFRGSAGAYASDPAAHRAATLSVSLGHDRKIDGQAREFFYMPLMHSESLQDQERCLRLFLLNMDDPAKILHARAHREVIRRFGRFPYRNAHLGRATTAPEQEFLDAGAYGMVVRALEAGEPV